MTRSFLRLRIGVAALALCAALRVSAAQDAAPTVKGDGTVARTLYFVNNDQRQMGEIADAVREAMGSPKATMKLVGSADALTIVATPAQLATAERVMHDLDRPQRTYRMTYTITEMDNGKRIGVQHCAIVIAAGGRSTLKQGSKIPINTGSYDTGKNGVQTQVTYLDVGLNFDVSIDQLADGVRLHQKVESSGIAEERSGIGAEDPIVRQTVLESTSTLFPGKPLMLGSLDVPGSTRHLDIEVEMEPVK